MKLTNTFLTWMLRLFFSSFLFTVFLYARVSDYIHATSLTFCNLLAAAKVCSVRLLNAVSVCIRCLYIVRRSLDLSCVCIDCSVYTQ